MLYKTKQEYLRELTRELRGYFKKKDVQNIIYDYTEFFDAGISEGKSEIEICEKFGDIKNLAREIADNQIDVKLKIKKEKYIDYIVIFILGAVIIFLYWISHYSASMLRTDYIRIGNYFINVWQISIFFTPPLIFIFIKLYKKYEINFNEKILFILTFIPIIWVFINVPIGNSNQFPIEIGIVIDATFFIISLLILIIALFIFISLRNDKLDYISFTSVLFILTCLYQTFNNILSVFGNMDTPNGLLSWIINALFPLIFGLSIAAIVYLFSFWRKYLPKFKSKSQKERD